MAQRKRNPGAIRDLESIVNPVTGDITAGSITTTSNVLVGGNLTVCGDASVEGNMTVSGNHTVGGIQTANSIVMNGTNIRHPVRFGAVSLANAVVALTTSVEAWANNIDVTIVDLSTTTVAPPILQFGTLTGLVTSGYGGAISKTTAGGTVTGIANDNGFRLSVGHAAARSIQGQLSIIRHGTGHTWSVAMKGAVDDQLSSIDMGGNIVLPGDLTTLSLRTTSGTATEVYDGGSVAGVIRY